MKVFIKACILTLFILYPHWGAAQYIFRHLSIVDGLSDNQIRNISMMPDKRLLIRTPNMMNVYDGASFRAYHQDLSREYKWANYKPPREYYDANDRVWLKSYESLLLFDLRTNRYIYEIEEILLGFGVKEKLVNLFIDDSKNYWFITESHNVLFYDIQKNQLFNITGSDSGFAGQHGIPREITQYKNQYWIIYSDGFICCWDYTTMEFIFQDETFFSVLDDTADKIHVSTTEKDRLYMRATGNGDLWLMLSGGIYYHDRVTRKWSEIYTISGHSNFFTCMDIDREGNVWVGTSNSGLRFIRRDTGEVTELPGLEIEGGEIINNDIFSVFVDDFNGVWVGTLFQGIAYYHPFMKKFNLHSVITTGANITNEDIWCFLEDSPESILIGTGHGLYRFYPVKGTYEQIYQKEIGDNICVHLYKDRQDRIWVSTFFNGLYCIDGTHIRNYSDKKFDINSYPNPNNIRCVFEDSKGNIWVSVLGGVGKLDIRTGHIGFLFEKHPRIEHHNLSYNIYEVDEGVLTVIGERGVYFYDIEADRIEIPGDNPVKTQEKFPDYELAYNCYYIDSRSLEWFGTVDGLRIWDEKNNRLYGLNTENGLQNSIISSILEDDYGIIWISTLNGISKIDITDNRDEYGFSILNFSTIDGLQSGKFNERAAIKTTNGIFYFGGVYGFNSFNPHGIVFNKSKHKPVFTSFSLFNSMIQTNKEYNNRIILNQIISCTSELTLNYNENFITLEFAGLNYVNPERTYFRYKLMNFDSDWNEIITTGAGKVTYTKLAPGTYKLIVYTANNDKVWGDEPAEITITIRPPWWATPVAYMGYILLFILLTIILVTSGGSRKESLYKPLWEMIYQWDAWQPLHKEARVVAGEDAFEKLKENRPDLPVMILEGKSENNPFSTNPEILEYLPAGRLRVLEDCGHIMNMEQPELFNAVLSEFINNFNQ